MSANNSSVGKALAQCPVCDAALDPRERAGQFHHPHWNSLSLLPDCTITESQIAGKIEHAARHLAAEKIGDSDPRGFHLADVVWKPAITDAVALLKLETLSDEDRRTILNAAAALEARP